MPPTTAQAVPAPLAPDRPGHRRGRSTRWIYAGIALGIAAAWSVVRFTGLRAGSEAGYWTGVAGGTLMLLLFAYPLRKRVRFMAHWGAAKWWFAVHMVLGIAGPLLVLVHSTFRVGSLNAAVALYSMLVVAGSGVVGRFLYLQVHRGLSGERETLAHLQLAAGLRADSVHSMLAQTQAGALDRRLVAFEQQALAGRFGFWRQLGAFTVLPWQRRRMQDHCARELRRSVRRRIRDRAEAAAEFRRERAAIDAWLLGVQRVAQFQAATRLFSLWHVLHVPIVWLMVLCAIAHVVAVHAY